jgi:hypothetical protein
MNGTDEEHHGARVLIAELDDSGPANDHRVARFTVFAESVRQHITEEEDEILLRAKELTIDFEAPGPRMLERKESLKTRAIASDREHVVVAAAPAGGLDIPAAAAQRARRRGNVPSEKHRNSEIGPLDYVSSERTADNSGIVGSGDRPVMR